jgi:hypothetical protein
MQLTINAVLFSLDQMQFHTNYFPCYLSVFCIIVSLNSKFETKNDLFL